MSQKERRRAVSRFRRRFGSEEDANVRDVVKASSSSSATGHRISAIVARRSLRRVLIERLRERIRTIRRGASSRDDEFSERTRSLSRPMPNSSLFAAARRRR
jgi:hypothetical protein